MKKKNVLIAGVASLAVIAATAYLVIRRKEAGGDLPPRAAPQLDLNNPGDQSDFPAGPSGEVELG